MDIKLFDYSLPRSFIAQKPLKKRDHSKLLILDKASGKIIHDRFYNLGKYLKRGDVLVINKSKVWRCRLSGLKENTGAAIECFVLKRKGHLDYEALLRPSKRLKESDRVFIGKNYFKIIKKLDGGRALIKFNIPAEDIFLTDGEMPFPPYITSKDIDGERYQTVYAEKEGSTASPTAGLHFTPVMMDYLKKQGIIFAGLSLDIGLGTFRPVSADRIEDHKMHEEYYRIEKSQAEIIDEAKKSGRRIVAVGTTSVRVLETLMQKYGKIKESEGYTGIYIHPPYKFRAVDCMITNFHLPRSSLLIMISAFAGRENIFRVYHKAMEKNYRFYSFGDCMFIK